MQKFTVKSQQRNQMIEVTHLISQALQACPNQDGSVIAFVPHTTAGITINENADSDVACDMLLTLNELVPEHRAGYRHGEGNSDSHVKATLTGSSVTVFFEKGQLILGRWQGIYFCEFDGPRTRKLFLQINCSQRQ